MEAKFYSKLALVLLYSDLVSCYCQDGKNPSFKGAPKVTQINLDVVRISWKDLVINKHCADNFLVKYWPKINPNDYKISEKVNTSREFVDIQVTPRIIYQFLAVAREEKGILLGVDWNKSPIVTFSTSTQRQV